MMSKGKAEIPQISTPVQKSAGKNKNKKLNKYGR